MAFWGEGLECPQRRALAAEYEVANGPPFKITDSLGNTLANADARAELLVHRLEPGGRVDSIAVSGVIEKAAAAEVPDDCGPGVNSDARHPEHDAVSPPACTKLFREGVELHSAGHGAGRVVRLVGRRPE